MRTLLIALTILLAIGPVTAADHSLDVPCPVSASPELLKQFGPVRTTALAGMIPQSKLRPEDELYAAMQAKRGSSPDKVAGTGTCLVILFEWTDHTADQVAHPQSGYDDMMFSTGTYPTGSMNDFYIENSYGAYSVGGLVHGWNTSAALYSAITPTDYGQVRSMIEDAIDQLDPIIDYSQYDNDGPDGIPDSGDDDGYVDSLFFVHAGPGREETGDTNDIWSHAWSFYQGHATNDGVSFFRYSVEPEMLADGTQITVGVFAHEYGHVIGLPDVYDTDYSSSGIGNWGLMSGGSWGRRDGEPAGSSPSHMTAWSKMQMGWLTPTTITATTTGVTIPPAETNAVAYRIWRDGATTGDEYFLVENRRRLGFDESLVRRQISYGLAAPEGLAIYHVDDSVGGNSNENHRLLDVVESSPWFTPGGYYEHLDLPRDGSELPLVNPNRGDDGDLWPGFSFFSADSTQWVGTRDRDRFADNTIPSAQDYSCDATGLAIENIALSGTDVIVDFTIGAKAKPTASPDKILTSTFETGTDGWMFCDGYVHHDLTQAGTCSGNGGLWFGLDNPDYVCPPGYGNNWDDFTWKTVAVTAGATISLRHHYDLESGYDYGIVEARCAGDANGTWTQIAAVNGASSCVTDTWAIPGSVLSACDTGSGVAVIDVRLRMTSDGAWSAEDGDFCGIGWWIDEVSFTNDVSTGVDDLPGMGVTARLLPAEPNPFNPATVLKYHIPAGSKNVSMVIFDQRGRAVRNLEVTGEPGWQQVLWDGRDGEGRTMSGGVYFARLTVDRIVEVQKLALLK